MTKLVEREAMPRSSPLAVAPALAVQFFLIPLAVVAVAVLVYAGFRWMLVDDHSPEDYLNDIRAGGRERRWPAAFELSRLMAAPEGRALAPTLGPALVRAFVESRGDDPRVRRYLALALGRLQAPPPEAIPALLDALADPESETRISVIWALGSLGDPSVVPKLQELYASDDAGVRKIVVYALGALPGDGQIRTLRTALNDAAPDVQWNAAVALARHGDGSGVGVLGRMLDRSYVEQTVTRTPDRGAGVSPADEVIASSLQAVAVLGERSLYERVATLSRADRSLRVRQAALEVLKRLEPAGSS